MTRLIRGGRVVTATDAFDADVLIAGLLSRTGASHAILLLGDLGLMRLIVPDAAVAEVGGT